MSRHAVNAAALPSSGRTAVLVGRFIVEQDAVGGAFQILVLAGAERPQEDREAAAAEQQARTEQVKDDVHQVRPCRRKLFASTTSDEPDIAAAASQGVTNPATASGTISAL